MKISNFIIKILLFFVKIYRFFFESKDEIQEKYYSDKDNINRDSNFNNNNEDSSNILTKYDEELNKADYTKNHDTKIKPINYHQRNLSVETGGCEAKEQHNIKSHDIWDDRSEEVDEMSIEGARKSINTTAKRSMLWRLKRKRSQKEKEEISDKMEIAQEKRSNLRDRIKNSKNNSSSGRSI